MSWLKRRFREIHGESRRLETLIGATQARDPKMLQAVSVEVLKPPFSRSFFEYCEFSQVYTATDPAKQRPKPMLDPKETTYSYWAHFGGK